MSPKGLSSWLGNPIEDATEETFILFSQPRPSHDLGFVNGKAGDLEVDIGSRTLNFKQSPGLLNSQRNSGTTGAVLWAITPLMAEWLASLPSWLQEAKVLNSNSTVVELGCGITGLLGIVLAEKVSNYLLTDQGYVIKVLQHNVRSNMLTCARNKTQATYSAPNLRIIELDWEANSASGILQDVPNTDHVNLAIACDCVYNEHLIQPLVQTLVEVCTLAPANAVTTVMVAQQLRSDSVLEEFLDVLLRYFVVWRVSDSYLPASLQTGTGYVIHLAQLKRKAEMQSEGA